LLVVSFFLSGRGRHTRSYGDWSSDVCSSDLAHRRVEDHVVAVDVHPDGSLHNTVVWVDVDGDDVIFNTAVGRAKERHLRQDDREIGRASRRERAQMEAGRGSVNGHEINNAGS